MQVAEMQSLAEMGCAKNARLEVKRAYFWARAVELKEEIVAIKAWRVVEQDLLLQVFLHKLLQSNTFSEYVNFCSIPIMDAATVKVVLPDFPNLDIKKKYGYFEDMRECLNEFCSYPNEPFVFPLSDTLKSRAEPLTGKRFCGPR